MSNNNNEMKKELGMGAAMATVVGCVIGSGVFFKPTAIYTATGGAPGCGTGSSGCKPGKAVPGRRHSCSCGNRMYHHHGCAELHGR